MEYPKLRSTLIANEICYLFRTSLSELREQDKSRQLSETRQIVIYLCNYLKISTSEICLVLGRSYSSVQHSLKSIDNLKDIPEISEKLRLSFLYLEYRGVVKKGTFHQFSDTN
jgi:chromosomal replication initiation ATPase DnaA